MAQIISSILIFVGLACLSAALAVLVGMLALHIRLPFGRNRNVPRELRLAEMRKITRVNDPSPKHFEKCRNTTSPRTKAAPTHVPLQIRARFRRAEWRLKPSDRLSHEANWN